ncbi:MAG: DUF485 domain-containing protein [Planctomycetota bacterium]
MTEPSRPSSPDLPPASRLGLMLCVLYCLFYGGFIALAVLNPKLMAMRVGFGGNVAIWYGFGLIIAAFVLAVIYLLARRNDVDG